MAKIQEIYQKQWEQKWEGLTFRSIPDQQSHIFAAMKEYAEYYAEKCLEIAESHIFQEVYCAEIYPTEIKLPDHD